jgi:hypothetical protein
MANAFPTGIAVDTGERFFVTDRDPVGWLPPLAATKLNALKQAVTDAHAVLVPTEDMREHFQERAGIDRRLAELTRHPTENGHGLGPDAPQVVAENKKLKRVNETISRLKALDEIRAAKWTEAGRVVQTVESFLRGIPAGCSLAEVEDDAAPAILKKGETLVDGVERLRHRNRELKADLHRVRSSPFPKATARQRLLEQIDAMATNAPDTSQLIEHSAGKITFPTKQVSAMVHNAQGGEQIVFVEVVDTAAMFATVMRDQLIAWADTDLDAAADDANALTPEQRQVQEATITSDMLATERQEAALVWKAMADDLGNVAHRSDCSPLALLGLRLVASPRAAPPPPSWLSFGR